MSMKTLSTSVVAIALTVLLGSSAFATTYTEATIQLDKKAELLTSSPSASEKLSKTPLMTGDIVQVPFAIGAQKQAALAKKLKIYMLLHSPVAATVTAQGGLTGQTVTLTAGEKKQVWFALDPTTVSNPIIVFTATADAKSAAMPVVHVEKVK